MQKFIKVIFMMCLVLNVSSCTNWKRNYCPSSGGNYEFDVPCDETMTSEKDSRDTYRVNGRTYHALTSSKNYEERGNASWYGRRFNRKRTYSGERFNMHQMTAAHKTLPMNTRLLVTNLLNGKQVVVRVNDRGPFVSNRLIDLSYVAAKKIGMVGHGVVPVNVKAMA